MQSCHSRFDGPAFSITEHPVFYNFDAVVVYGIHTVTLSRCLLCEGGQWRALAPVHLGS